MSTLPTTPESRATAITRAYAAGPLTTTERHHRAIDKKFARRERIIELRHAVDRMAQRQSMSEFNYGLHAGLGHQEETERHARAARRQREAFWRLLNTFEAEANR
ncbi:hypothetical protein AB0N38_14360 [Micromonospora aurantiaca]|uniref:hypothetical protein n=1 Tax=Micromonospora aurantiaca (nom. illeg.) TaxID=47850 RepID=UPI00342019AF